METKIRQIRLDDEVFEALSALSGKTVNDKLRSLLLEQASSNPIMEILELVHSLPDAEQIETIVEAVMQRKIDERKASRPAAPTFDPASIPGVQVGTSNLKPRRESPLERGQREMKERRDRVTRMDTSAGDRDDIVRDDEFVSL